MSSEPFITRARQRLDWARLTARSAPASASSRALLDLLPLVDAVIDAVDSEGTLPASLCTVVVKYGAVRT